MKNKAVQIVKILQEAGHEAVFAGGCVRDMFLGIEPHDFDIATSATPDQVEKLFKNTKSVGKAFGVILVRLGGVDFEVATFRNDGNYSDGRRPDTVIFSSMLEDAQRRDFTINAMFFDPITEKVIDFVGGLADLKAKTIRFVGEPEERIQEDNLRLLRAVRFAIKLGFTLNKKTFFAVREHSLLVRNVAPERIREEFVKMIKVGNPNRMMDLLMSTGLMEQFLPEVVEMDKSPQNPKWHPEGNVFIHTVLVMEKLKNESLEVQLAGLFHDIGKPATMVMVDGQPTNKGHDKLGAEMTEEIMLRLKFSNKEIELVKNLVANHMKINQVQKFKKSTLKRYLALPFIEELILLGEADARAATQDASPIGFIRDRLNEWEPEEIKPEPLVTGKDLIELGFEPGPIFKVILEKVETAQLEGTITKTADAINYIINIMNIY